MEYRTKFVEPRIYDRQDAAKLAELPTEIRGYVEKNEPLIRPSLEMTFLNWLISIKIIDTGWMSGINARKR